MTLIPKWVIALPCLLGLHASSAAHPPVPMPHVIRLTSSECPPYSSAALPARGASTAVIRAALAKMGYRLEVDFFPWRRTVVTAGHDADFICYFPEYWSSEIERECLLSTPIGTGPLGFAERSDAPVQWNTLDDLTGYTIGIVDGYVNPDALDRRIRERKQPSDAAQNDVQNLIKLAAGRISLAVIDRRVFKYLTRNDARLNKVASRLRFNSRLLEEKQLFVCFRRSQEGEQARRILNEGLKRIDVPAVMAPALE